MLDMLFGNPNIERILLFLFVNERAYASQIQSALSVPLTPIQQALARLERGAFITKSAHGNKQIYQISGDSPFHPELTALLKKRYTLLSPEEKKRYCYLHKPRLLFAQEIEREQARTKALTTFWKQLAQVKHLFVTAKSETECKTGEATIRTQLSGTRLTFEESGEWLTDKTAFTNTFRWNLDAQTALITLEHLRYGTDHPVFLLNLTPTQPRVLESVDAHLCGKDTYLGNIVWKKNAITFYWRIIGPKKNTHLTYRYS